MPWTKEAREKALEKKKKTGNSNQYSKAKSLGLPVPSSPNKGKPNLTWKPHSEETKQKIKTKALASNHRRLVKSVREYITKSGEKILLDSSWEEALAIKLDELNIIWERPLPLKWIDKNNTERKYFPDFYLPEYDVYLDPKNPAAMKQQKEKVAWIKANIKNVLFLQNLNEIYAFNLAVVKGISQ